MANALGIHLIGGYGESIIVEMPNGGVGVIDCFAPQLKAENRIERLQANPTLRFLVNHLKATRLAFLGFTHPHEDHGRGLTHLLEEFRDRIDSIWVFPSFQTIALERWFAAAMTRDMRLPIERLLDESPGTFFLELVRFRELVHQQCAGTNPLRARFRSFYGRKSFSLDGEPIHIHFLGPTDDLVRRYEGDLTDNMRDLVEERVIEGENRLVVRPEWRPDALNHNRISPALLIEYGKTRILLGGDMECEAWQTVLDEMTSEESAILLTCHFIKISHHGSPTGPPDDLYRRLARNKGRRPLAVLTPYNRHLSPLPSSAGLAMIRPRVENLLATNLAEAQLALALGRARPAISIPLPGDLLAVLTANPGLWGALDPSLGGPASGAAPLDEIPGSLLPLLEANPALVDFLNPRLHRRWDRRHLLPSTFPEDECRISIYFNHRGMELRSHRHVGARGGPIP